MPDTPPSPSWALVRMYGTWNNMDGTMKAGKYRVNVPARVTNSTDDVIIPSGTWKTGDLNVVPGNPSLDIQVPATNDPDNEQVNWKLEVIVNLDDGQRESFSVEAPYNSEGIDLRTIALPAQLPASKPTYRVGEPGGLAQLNADGDVIDADGNVVGSGGGGGGEGGPITASEITDSTTIGRSLITASSASSARSAIGAGTSSFGGSYDSLTGKPVLQPVATSGSYNDLTSKPSIPTTAADLSAVPTSRTVNGHALTGNVTVTASDIGALTGTGIDGIVALTQTEYDAIPSKSATTFYIITGA